MASDPKPEGSSPEDRLTLEDYLKMEDERHAKQVEATQKAFELEKAKLQKEMDEIMSDKRYKDIIQRIQLRAAAKQTKDLTQQTLAVLKMKAQKANDMLDAITKPYEDLAAATRAKAAEEGEKVLRAYDDLVKEAHDQAVKELYEKIAREKEDRTDKEGKEAKEAK